MIKPVSEVHNRCSWFESNFSMSIHISKSCSATFFWLHNIKRISKLYWLSVRYRIQLKILLSTFKTLNGMAPAYNDLINVRKHAHYSLRSNSGTILLHPAGKM